MESYFVNKDESHKRVAPSSHKGYKRACWCHEWGQKWVSGGLGLRQSSEASWEEAVISHAAAQKEHKLAKKAEEDVQV